MSVCVVCVLQRCFNKGCNILSRLSSQAQILGCLFSLSIFSHSLLLFPLLFVTYSFKATKWFFSTGIYPLCFRVEKYGKHFNQQEIWYFIQKKLEILSDKLLFYPKKFYFFEEKFHFQPCVMEYLRNTFFRD